MAFWLWASGFEKGIRYTYSENFWEYYKNENIFSEVLTPDDIFLEKMMFDLRTSWLTDNIYKKLSKKRIHEFIADWYLVFQKNKLCLTTKWVLLWDYILKEII